MLPKGSLGRDYARKLKIYPAEEHPHAAQKPILLNIGRINLIGLVFHKK